MDIAIHLGAHCTDEDRILRVLQQNSDLLAGNGIVVPQAGKARPALRQALQKRGAGLVGDDGAAELMQALTGGDTAKRVVISYEGFLGTYATVLSGTTMYPDAGKRAAMLRDLFPGHSVQFFLGIRNPATFVPAIFEASSKTDFGQFLSGHDLSRISWAEPLEALRAACPDVPLTVWCNEDLPLIWPDILRIVSGYDSDLTGETAILREVMSKSGFERVETYLRDNPPPTLATWHKVVTAFLGKYADPAKVEQDITLPGWSDDMIAGLSDLYERDLARIRAMPEVTFLQP